MPLTIEPNPIELPGMPTQKLTVKFTLKNESSHPVLFKLKQKNTNQIECDPDREIVDPNSEMAISLDYKPIGGSSDIHQIPVLLEEMELVDINPTLAEDLFAKHPGKSRKSKFFVTFNDYDELNDFLSPQASKNY